MRAELSIHLRNPVQKTLLHLRPKKKNLVSRSGTSLKEALVSERWFQN